MGPHRAGGSGVHMRVCIQWLEIHIIDERITNGLLPVVRYAPATGTSGGVVWGGDVTIPWIWQWTLPDFTRVLFP